MRTRFGVTPWLVERTRRQGPAAPRLRSRIETSVAIVGDGMPAAVIAYVFATAGVRLAVVSAGPLGAAMETADAGSLWPAPDAMFADAEHRYGRRAARRIWNTARRGALDCAAALRRLGVQARVAAAECYVVAATPAEAERLHRDCGARRDAGLEAVWRSADKLRRAAGVDSAGGIRTADGFHIDPYRARLGFIAASARRGAQFFERSPLRRVVDARAGGVDVEVEGGVVNAQRVIIAGQWPPAAFRPLQRHFTRLRTYAAATAPLPRPTLRALGSRALLRDTASPRHDVGWLDDERLLVGGADGPPPGARRAGQVLHQRTFQLMYELSRLYPAMSGAPPEFGWSEEVAVAADGLPFIGAHRNYPRRLFALGFGRSGPAFAFAAARILLRIHQGAPDKGDELLALPR
jgi:glycine/D-amino acid oxidase-like deaminating enzyme